MSRSGLSVRLMAFAVMLLAFALAGCGGATKSTGTFEAIRSSDPAASTAKPSAPADKPSATTDKPSAPASDQARLADQMTRIAGELNDLQNAVAKLIASSRQQDDQLTFLRRRVDELESQNRGRLPAAPSGFAPAAPVPPPAAAAAPRPTVSATTTPAADLYRAGTEKLRAKQLDAAILTFYDLITTYPDHPLRESAQFLVADILYTQKDYRGALGEFEALVSALPRGEKVPDALVKIGLCERDLGDGERAKRTWERVVGDYPSTAAARQARILLRN